MRCEIFHHPDQPLALRVSVDDGDAGVFEIDLADLSTGTPTDDGIPVGWVQVTDLSDTRY